MKPCEDIFNYFSGGFSSTDASQDPKCEVKFDKEGLIDIVNCQRARILRHCAFQRPEKSKVEVNLLDTHCVQSTSEINAEDETGVNHYLTYLFTTPSVELNLILFNPELTIFACEIGYYLNNETGENSKLDVKGMISKPVIICDGSVDFKNSGRKS